MSLEEKFQAAVSLIRGLPKTGPLQPTDDERLLFYSLFKQATVGKNNQPQPAFYNLIEKAKWNAWNKLGNMTKEKAMHKYIDAVRAMIAKIAETINIMEWLGKINPELPKKFALITAES